MFLTHAATIEQNCIALCDGKTFSHVFAAKLYASLLYQKHDVCCRSSCWSANRMKHYINVYG